MSKAKSNPNMPTASSEEDERQAIIARYRLAYEKQAKNPFTEFAPAENITLHQFNEEKMIQSLTCEIDGVIKKYSLAGKRMLNMFMDSYDMEERTGELPVAGSKPYFTVSEDKITGEQTVWLRW